MLMTRRESVMSQFEQKGPDARHTGAGRLKTKGELIQKSHKGANQKTKGNKSGTLGAQENQGTGAGTGAQENKN